MTTISIRNIVTAAAIVSSAASATALTSIQTYCEKDKPLLYIETTEGFYMPGYDLDIDYTSADDGSYIMNFIYHTYGFGSRSSYLHNSIPVNDIVKMQLYNPYTETITQIDCDNEEWDAIYASPAGYFAMRYAQGENDNPDYDEIRYLSFNGYAVSMFFDADSGIPLSLVADDIRLNFYASPFTTQSVDENGNPSDEEYDFLCNIDCFIDVMSDIPQESRIYTPEGTPTIVVPKAKLPGNIHEYAYIMGIIGDYNISADNPLAPYLFAIARCLSDIYISHSSYPLLSSLYSAFDTISRIPSVQKCGEAPSPTLPPIGKSMGHPGNPGGGTKVTSNIVAQTQGSKNITDTEATLTGAIHCHSPRFRTEGTYGILVDTDKSKLIKGEAKYDFPGTQGKLKLSFDVQASGLDPNTDYYYRAYYKLNSAKSDLSIKFDNRDPNKISDKTPTETYGRIKTFTTLPPDISGVWHFVNHVFADNLYFDLKYDPHTGTYKAHDFYGVFSLEVKVSRDRSVTLYFTSHVSGAGFSGYFNEDYSAAKGSGTSTYMSDPTPFNMTR